MLEEGLESVKVSDPVYVGRMPMAAATAGPPSPADGALATPRPATVDTSPAGEMARTRALPASVTYSVPVAVEKAREDGLEKSAAERGPPSPAKPGRVHVPAYVVMTPVAALTARTQWLPVSAMSTAPVPAFTTALPCGEERHAAVAGPPSPQYAGGPPGVPASRRATPPAETSHTADLSPR